MPRRKYNYVFKIWQFHVVFSIGYAYALPDILNSNIDSKYPEIVFFF